MEEISADAYTALVRSCRVLEKDGSGEKVLLADDGLIDIADMRFSRRALSIKQRQRNFRHMLRYTVDSDFFHSVTDQFWPAYKQAAQLSDDQCQQLRSSRFDNSADRN